MRKILFFILFTNFIYAANSQYQVIVSDSTSCGPFTAEIQLNTYNNVDSLYWDFGNGTNSIETTPVSVDYTEGFYHVACLIYHDGDQTTTLNNFNLIKVYELPDGEFVITDSVNENSYKIVLQLNTENNNEHDISFGDGTNEVVSENVISHTYPEAGEYVILNEATNSFGCSDSFTDSITISNHFVVPNVFTPNNDGMNDVFKIRTNGKSQFELEIYTRTGTLVYKTVSANPSWDGTTNYGTISPTGVYYYVIKDISKDSQNQAGFMHLYR